MFDPFHQSSVPDASGILLTVAILWGVWPVICGALGATRGQTFKGIMHGFLWGPIGIIIILLSSQKYECPTCRQKTLRQPYDDMCSTPPVLSGMPSMARKAAPLYPRIVKPAASNPMPPYGEPAPNPVAPLGEPPPRAARPASPVVPNPANRTPPNPATAPDRREPVLAPPSGPEPRCDPEEAEKLHDWVNSH